MIRRSLARRSGFALMLVMTAILLLMIFLLAAQGSVQMSHAQMKRASEKMESAERTALILAGATRALGKSTGGATREFTPHSEGLEWSLRRLETGDPIYAELPGVAPRAEDGLVVVKESGKGFSRETRYLINGAGKRTGAIRLPASAGAPAKPAQGAKP